MLGTTRGMTPKNAYFARMSNTCASAGIAGYGMPLKSMRPITAVTSTFLSIGSSRNAFGQRDANARAGFGDQFVGEHRAVGVAEAPEQLGVADVCRGEVVGPVAAGDRVHSDRRQGIGVGDEPPPDV